MSEENKKLFVHKKWKHNDHLHFDIDPYDTDNDFLTHNGNKKIQTPPNPLIQVYHRRIVSYIPQIETCMQSKCFSSISDLLSSVSSPRDIKNICKNDMRSLFNFYGYKSRGTSFEYFYYSVLGKRSNDVYFQFLSDYIGINLAIIEDDDLHVYAIGDKYRKYFPTLLIRSNNGKHVYLSSDGANGPFINNDMSHCILKRVILRQILEK